MFAQVSITRSSVLNATAIWSRYANPRTCLRCANPHAALTKIRLNTSPYSATSYCTANFAMAERSNVDYMKEVHKDLVRRYKNHGPKLEQIWRSFSSKERVEAMKAGAAEGLVLESATDRKLGNVYQFIPEWNLHDAAKSGPEFLLKLLKHRATTSLAEQYCAGPDDSDGDAEFMKKSMRQHGFRCPHSYPPNCFTIFLDGEKYGKSFEIFDPTVITDLSLVFEAGLCVPRSTGELIIVRQMYITQLLHTIVEDILDIGSTSRISKPVPTKPKDAMRDTLSTLSLDNKHQKLQMKELIANAEDQKAAQDDDLRLLCSEPAYLAHAVNIWFFSKPELVQDEKGRVLQLMTDTYIGAAVFEVVQNAITGLAFWDYLFRLLILLDETSATEKSYRTLILQEISNVCDLVYRRVQSIFKRHVQTGIGSKYFKRLSNISDNGVPRVVLKGKPEQFTRLNPQLHYALRLCQSETDAAKAIHWIKQLDHLHQMSPLEKDYMLGREFDTFADIALVADYIGALSSSLPVPTVHRRKPHGFEAKLNVLTAELAIHKTQLDLTDFAAPIDQLMEPGMADAALRALDQFVSDKTGATLGFHFQTLLDEALSDLKEQYNKLKTQQKQKEDIAPLSALAISAVNAPDAEEIAQQKRLKQKTRPVCPSAYNLNARTPIAMSTDEVPSQVTFEVKQKTADVFFNLFSNSESRDSVMWTAFQAAMADLKFSVVPRTGSVFTFIPPDNMNIQRSITFHRPHKPRIEGHMLLHFAYRLKKVYGWTERSFEVAQRCRLLTPIRARDEPVQAFDSA